MSLHLSRQVETMLANLSSAQAALLGAFLGASAAILGGLALEAYKRRRDRQGVATAFAAAINTVLWTTERRRHLELFESILAKLEAGEPQSILGMVHEDHLSEPLADALQDKLGSIGGSLSSRTARFFSVLYGIRIDLMRLRDGHFGPELALQAHIIKEDIALWRENVVLDKKLMWDLRLSEKGPIGKALIWVRRLYLFANRTR